MYFNLSLQEYKLSLLFSYVCNNIDMPLVIQSVGI